MAEFPDRCGPEDRILIAGIAQGNHEAFQRLMGRHLPFVLALAQRLIGRRADADEIAQEAFLRVWTTAPRWRQDGEAQFRTWLYRVVVNLCLDRQRRPKTAPLEDAGDVFDPRPDSLELVAASETERLIARALDELPPKQKAALVLCYYSEVSGAEAARILEVSESAVESLLVRGRRGLRQRLEAFAGIKRMET
ncbi:MAG: RNA polymerase sigma factor [Azospirillum sp.]|nr:RNA polymerase sigma factor [Azospirillum sp.]